jgi:hypothetical protein
MTSTFIDVFRFMNATTEAMELGCDVAAELIVENGSPLTMRFEEVRARAVKAENNARLIRIRRRIA